MKVTKIPSRLLTTIIGVSLSKIKRRMKELEHDNEMWQNFLDAPSSVKIKNNYFPYLNKQNNGN